MQQFDTSRDSNQAILGRHQILYRNPGKAFERPILAAGAVLWRGTLPNPEIATIHRPHYNDWSLPKGKVDPGEALPVTAAREIEEETGFSVQLGKLLGNISYPVGNHTKVVFYWTAQVLDGEFSTNNEVDEIRWLPIKQALEQLSYTDDRSVVEKAAKRFAYPTQSRLLVVRAAKTAEQVELLMPLLATYRPNRIIAATDQCSIDTATPIAEYLGISCEVDEYFGESGWIRSMKTAQQKITEIIEQPGVTIVVSDKRTIQDSIAWMSTQGTLPLEKVPAKRASTWVLGFHQGALHGADYLESPKPVRKPKPTR
ncbi:NUDIX hydrolase [Corynebacterium freiburgense]|uniref:NUDIX hydrolase n=1 Tax=Corynebacterium freiburgense TaxID=556548 RepID=UPI00047878F1|nr:NUDIX hydrolase [Corynebacterium freiburgense]